jgi:hypothetical protein
MPPDQDDKKPESPDTSDVVDKVAKLADAKVMTLLFGRAAQAAGDYFGEKAEDFFRRLREASRKKNIEDHVAKVIDVAGAPRSVEPFQIIRIERWMKVAADIPVEDVERSAVIEAVLDNIVSKAGDTSEFQEAAEKLTNSTARLLLNAPAERIISPKETDERGFEELKSLGLAGTPGKRQLLNDLGAWLIGTIGGLIVLFGFIIRYAPTLLPRYFPTFLATEFVAEAVVISAVILVLGVLALSTRYRLTHLGKSLQHSANRFYRNDPRVQQKPVFPHVPRPTWIMWGGLGALIVCALPFALQAYLPRQLRIDAQPPTVIISSPPATASNPTPPSTAPSTSSPASPQPQGVTLTADDIRMMVDFWRSVSVQMNDILTLTDHSGALLSNWPQRVGDGAFVKDIVKQRDEISQRFASLQALYTAYQSYPNVRATLEDLGAKGFTRVNEAFNSFVNELNLGTPPPNNFENTLRPYATELKGALDMMAKWAINTRDFAQRQSDELSQIDLR